MIATIEDVKPDRAGTIFHEGFAMPKKKAITGRPESFYIPVVEMEDLGDMLAEAGDNLKKAAAKLKEVNCPSMLFNAKKMVEEIIPSVQAFSVKVLSAAGPAAHTFKHGKKSPQERNKERYRRSIGGAK